MARREGGRPRGTLRWGYITSFSGMCCVLVGRDRAAGKSFVTTGDPGTCSTQKQKWVWICSEKQRMILYE